MSKDRINVTRTFLPPIEEYNAYIKEAWDTGYITNQGPLLQKFETHIREYLNVENFHFVSNGTIALQIAMRSLGITGGEVITTPFSYVATTSSILWERCSPVFVDIEPNTFSIDVSKIEAAITKETKAIMPVHVFGFPCDIEGIEKIAKKYNLKVIYDAAHAFGVKYKGRSLLDYGDIAISSFHATKLFHTIEGGGIFTRDQTLHSTIDLIKRFGHDGDDHKILGINGKASEMHAAMGLCNLKYIDDIVAKRKVVCNLYDKLLNKEYVVHRVSEGVEYNYSYYPIVFKSEQELLHAVANLNERNIFPRRYFYPSLNSLSYLTNYQSCPVSEDISKRILCLPLYVELEATTIKEICEIINT